MAFIKGCHGDQIARLDPHQVPLVNSQTDKNTILKNKNLSLFLRGLSTMGADSLQSVQLGLSSIQCVARGSVREWGSKRNQEVHLRGICRKEKNPTNSLTQRSQ